MGQDEAFLLDGQSQREKKKSNDGLINLTWRPFDWFRKLSDVLHWSFVLSVVIVYGINQGLSLGLSRISIQYYMKDEQKLQPSEAQIFTGIISLPWIVKPLWGLLTDILPIAGFRRKPYLIIAGSLGVIAMLTLSMNQLRIELALLCLMAGSAGVAIADVIIDACVTENSISHPSLAGDMQSLCGGSSSVGQLIGYMISGFLVHLIGSKGVFGILSMPPSLVVLVGIMMQEKKFMPSGTYRRVSQKFADAGKAMVMALKCKTIWRPCLYMYISLAVSLHIHEGMFYWYTDAKDGPSFSQEVVGSISSVGAVGSLLGVLLYHNAFRHHPFRRVLFWSQLLFGASGLLDLILVSRINLKFGIPDYFVAVSDAAVTHMIARLKWMPLLVLSSKLCPSGIEGTFFALLMSIDHAGMLSASWAGGFLLHIFNVTRTQFDNLWIVIVVRSFLRVLPIGLLFLVPSSDPTASILPIEMLPTKKGESSGKTDDTEMATTLIKTVDQTLAEE